MIKDFSEPILCPLALGLSGKAIFYSFNYYLLSIHVPDAGVTLVNRTDKVSVCFLWFFKIYFIFIWLCWVLVASCGIFVAACGIFSCGMRALSCGMQDLVPWPGMEPGSPALGAWSLNHWTTMEIPRSLFSHAKWLKQPQTRKSVHEVNE